jgi:hypothetical protein
MVPNHRQELQLVTTPGGFRAFGIFAVDGRQPGMKAGINEKGLVIVSGAASCIPMAERARAGGIKQLLIKILASCENVDAVLKKLEMFVGPGFFMVADPTQVALIEVGLNNQRTVQTIRQGVLFHTNHFLDGTLSANNKLQHPSSYFRLARIRYLLKSHPQPFKLTDFIAHSEDQNDGPDNSIWRTGGGRGKIRTLAAWVVALPPNEAPILYVKLADNPNSPQTRQLRLDAAFWAGQGK